MAMETEMSRCFDKAILIILALTAATAARADVRLTERGPVAYLTSNRIMPGDAITLSEFLSRPRAEPLRIIYLDSKGGKTIVALRMAKMIHDQGLDTAFHVGRAHCASECTTLFAGGIHRYYIGGADVRDGVGTRRGLGFHPSNGSPALEDRVNDFYQQAGVPGAAQLRYRLYPRETINPTLGRRKMFFASGRTATQAGVATSLSEPPDPRLRD
jgi:hypothetical protein